MKEFKSDIQQECKEDNVYFVSVGKFGRVLDSKLKSIKWSSLVAKYIHACSCIPKQWLQKDNYLIEVACWFDGTAMYVHHGTKIDVLMCQFLEVSVHYLTQIHAYHALAAFPYKAVWVDVYKVIQLCLPDLVCFFL